MVHFSLHSNSKINNINLQINQMDNYKSEKTEMDPEIEHQWKIRLVHCRDSV